MIDGHGLSFIKIKYWSNRTVRDDRTRRRAGL